jgi:hypothetical protein
MYSLSLKLMQEILRVGSNLYK